MAEEVTKQVQVVTVLAEARIFIRRRLVYLALA